MTYYTQPQIFAGPIKGGGTSGPITLAVATTGNDADATRPKLIGAGDWSAKPFATIQAAINALPKNVDHDLIVNVGAGSFAGFVMKGFDFRADASIIGTRSTFVPATGPSGGNATGNDGHSSLVLSGAGWTPDDLVGQYLVVDSGAGAGVICPIWKNTADTLYTSYNVYCDATTVFHIEKLDTLITSPGDGWSACYFEANTVPDFLTVDSLKVTDLAASYPTAFCDWGGGTSGVRFTRCCAQAGSGRLYLGFYLTGGYSEFCEVFDADADGYGLGFYCPNVWSLYCVGFLAMGCVTGFASYSGGSIGLEVFYGIDCGEGLHVEDVHFFDSGSWGLILHDCGIGVTISNSHFSFAHVGIFDCTIATFVLRSAQLVRRAGWFYGTGNAGFGLNLRGVGNSFEDRQVDPYKVKSITGTSGDCSVDGATAIAWTDLDATGDFAVDAASGARVYQS